MVISRPRKKASWRLRKRYMTMAYTLGFLSFSFSFSPSLSHSPFWRLPTWGPFARYNQAPLFPKTPKRRRIKKKRYRTGKKTVGMDHIIQRWHFPPSPFIYLLQNASSHAHTHTTHTHPPDTTPSLPQSRTSSLYLLKFTYRIPKRFGNMNLASWRK
ncbi:hypothetical protein CI102_7375 [Trichoderma harzianum]|nr:hypothetical protein CI102_7375 [Trichoderma harzianum]